MRSALLPLLLLALLPLLACARGDAAPAPVPPSTRPVLVELFTSQGCSSCPPADEALAQLAALPAGERAVIPLAFHVDYWDRLGWRDPFSSAAWSDRQRRYAAAMGSNRVYTPQLVIGGSAECVGTDTRRLDQLVATTAAAPERATVSLRLEAHGRDSWKVAVSGERRRASDAPPAEVLVALFEDGLDTPVGRGENANRNLHNDRVVRHLARAVALPAGGGRGAAHVDIPIDPSWGRKLGVVAFVQEPSTLRVLAAAEATAQ